MKGQVDFLLPRPAGVEPSEPIVQDLLPVGTQRANAKLLDGEPDDRFDRHPTRRNVARPRDLDRGAAARYVEVGKRHQVRLRVPMEGDDLPLVTSLDLIPIANGRGERGSGCG